MNLVHPEQGEKLLIDGGGGDDRIDASAVVRDRIKPELRGSAGKDVLIGSPDHDLVGGGGDADIAFMGGGLDTFEWGPGEGSDIVEGGGGDNFLRMNGSGAAERFEVTALSSRTRVTRDVEHVALDLGDVTRIDILPGTGADTMHVGHLSGTDVTNVDFNFARARATIERDQAADSVLVDGTFGTDAITADGAGSSVRLTGLEAVVTTTFSDPALDRLHVDTKGGPSGRGAARRSERGRRQTDTVPQADPWGLLRHVASAQPDVAIVDIRMPPTHTYKGLVAARAIRTEHPGTGALVLASYVEPEYAARMLEDAVGGVGHLIEDRVSEIAVLVDALHRVADCETVVDSAIVTRRLKHRDRPAALSALTRQLIAARLAIGLILARVDRLGLLDDLPRKLLVVEVLVARRVRVHPWCRQPRSRRPWRVRCARRE